MTVQKTKSILLVLSISVGIISAGLIIGALIYLKLFPPSLTDISTRLTPSPPTENLFLGKLTNNQYAFTFYYPQNLKISTLAAQFSLPESLETYVFTKPGEKGASLWLAVINKDWLAMRDEVAAKNPKFQQISTEDGNVIPVLSFAPKEESAWEEWLTPLKGNRYTLAILVDTQSFGRENVLKVLERLKVDQ